MIKRFLFALALIGLCVFAVPASSASAFDIFGGADCSKSGAKAGDPTGSALCVSKDSGNPISGDDGAILKITNIVAFAAGVAAIIIIIVSGIRYIISDGDSGTKSKAKSSLVGAIVGLVDIVLVRTRIIYVVNNL